MASVLRLNRQDLRDLIDNIEAGGGDASELKRELAALGPDQDSRIRSRRHGPRFTDEEEPTLIERLDDSVGDLFSGGVTDELVAKLIEMDRNHSLKDLRVMCVEAGLSAGGDKKELCGKLLARGIL